MFNKENDLKSFLIDVYDYWIIENYKKLFLKKVVYVINIQNKRKIPKNLVEVLNFLTEEGFVLALKVKKDHVTIENLMNSVDFKFFIIESDFLANFSYWKYVDLILVKSNFTKNHVKMIFDGENKHLDDAQKKRIGFRFFY